MKLLRKYLRPHWRLIVLALILAAINQVFSLVDPLILRNAATTYAHDPSLFTKEEFIHGVMRLLLFSIGAAMVSRIAKNFQDYSINVVTQKIGAKLYQDGLAHSLSLPYQVFEDQRSGQTLNLLQKARTDTEKLISVLINILFSSLVGFVFVAIIAIQINWRIAIVYLAAVPIIGYLSSVLSKRIKKIQKAIVGETTALAGSTTESLRNIELIKSLGLAQQEQKHLNNITDRILTLELKKVRYIRSLSFIQGTTINFLRTCILFVLFYLCFERKLVVEDIYLMLMYSFYIFGPLQELGAVISAYRESEVSLNALADIFAIPSEPKPVDPISIGRLNKLSFNNVGFKHKSATIKALQDVSFEVKRGETVAFVGPSGAGKTSLVKLLVGLYRPDEGEVDYNDVRFDHVDMDALREKMGFVTQDTQLFSGTIRENLLFVNPKATDAECYEVLYKAACQNLLARADNGLDTVIGEGGVKVSGGEKQRLSIARSLLRNPDLLVFDEATSSLDSLTEEEITSTIRELSAQEERITILIAHRLSTIMHADKIYVLEKGRIIEHGKHEDLVELKGLYYAMWRQQIGESRSILMA